MPANALTFAPKVLEKSAEDLGIYAAGAELVMASNWYVLKASADGLWYL